MEYFCFQGDDLWDMDDDALIELGKRELAQLGLVDPAKVEKGYVTRVPLAYPMYDPDYGERVDAIRGWLGGIGNLQQVGRNGLHRYNNSDHSMLTAMRAVENLTHRHAPRHLGRERRIGLPRDRRAGRAPLPQGARDEVDAGAARAGRERVVSTTVWISSFWTFVRWNHGTSHGKLWPVWRASRTGPRPDSWMRRGRIR